MLVLACSSVAADSNLERRIVVTGSAEPSYIGRWNVVIREPDHNA